MKHVIHRIFVILAVIILGIVAVRLADKKIHVYETMAYAQYLRTDEERTDYIIEIGRMYLEQEDYLQAREAAEYVIYNYDGESDEAWDILDICRDKLRNHP